MKECLMSICNHSKIRADAEVFGLFRDLIPAEMTEQGGELQYGRKRVGLTPNLLLRLTTPDVVKDSLGEIECINRYPPGKTEKQADMRAKELPGLYRRPLERLNRK